MTPRELFEAMGPLVSPALERVMHRRDLCILATRVAIDVAEYFGIKAEPMPVKVMVYNAAFAKHVAAKFTDVADPHKPSTWGDGSWSVGIGYGKRNEEKRWDGHLIAVADGCYGDFNIQQAERLHYNIVTGTAIVGPYAGEQMWMAENDTGTVVEYVRTQADFWRTAPDWKDPKRRRPIVGALIRAVRQEAA